MGGGGGGGRKFVALPKIAGGDWGRPPKRLWKTERNYEQDDL